MFSREHVANVLSNHPFDASSEATATLCHRVSADKVWLVESPDRPDKYVLEAVRVEASAALQNKMAVAKLICESFDASNLLSTEGKPPLVGKRRKLCRVWEMEAFDYEPSDEDLLESEGFRVELENLVKYAEIQFPDLEIWVDLKEDQRKANIRKDSVSGDWFFTDPIGSEPRRGPVDKEIQEFLDNYPSV